MPKERRRRKRGKKIKIEREKNVLPRCAKRKENSLEEAVYICVIKKRIRENRQSKRIRANLLEGFASAATHHAAEHNWCHGGEARVQNRQFALQIGIHHRSLVVGHRR